MGIFHMWLIVIVVYRNEKGPPVMAALVG